MSHDPHVHPFRRLLLVLFFLLPLGLIQQPAAASKPPPVAPKHPRPVAVEVQQLTTLDPFEEVETNENLTTANAIGPDSSDTTSSWEQSISGIISSTDDLDWFAFTTKQPGSAITLTLSSPPADFDIALAIDDSESEGEDSGMENVMDLRRRGRSSGDSLTAARRRGRSSSDSISSIRRRGRSSGGDVTAASTEPDLDGELIETVLWQSGTYYVFVAGNNGATSDTPYHLTVEVDSSGLTQPSPAPAIGLPGPPDPTVKVQTLFIMSTSRMKQLYPGDTAIVDAIAEKINSLASQSEVNGVVFDLTDTLSSGSETITDTYEQWDADPANPFQANRVATLVDNIVSAATVSNTDPLTGDPSLPLYPDVEFIVLIGGDSVIPMYRVPDMTTFANESEYADYLAELDPTGIVGRDTPLGGSLRYRTTLTDDIYADDDSYTWSDSVLYVPDRAVGRLVESPEQILVYLEHYFNDVTPLEIDAWNPDREAIVTGYDFLTDQAEEVTNVIRTFGFTETTSLKSLISEDWDATDLGNAWFSNRLDDFGIAYLTRSAVQLQSINAHFDHWQAIPAAADTNFSEDTFYAERILTPTNGFTSLGDAPLYFLNRVCYSVGCHSGLNVESQAVVDGTADSDLYRADFPEAFLKQGGIYIGNTGYGYGDYDLIGYSERLSLLLTKEFGRNDPDTNDLDNDGITEEYGGHAIGKALMRAKQRYARSATNFDSYDSKSLMQMTLYGLPFLPVKVANPGPPPSYEETPESMPTDIPPADAMMGRYERTITFTLNMENQPVARTGSQYPEVGKIDIVDTFGPPSDIIFDVPPEDGYPALPQFVYDLSRKDRDNKNRMVLKDVEFIAGTYDEDNATNYDPQVSQIITQSLKWLTDEDKPVGTDYEPDFASWVGSWYPDIFFHFSSTGDDEDRRDQLLVTPAQFLATDDGTKGEMRRYKQMIFKAHYIDPDASQAQEAMNDTMPPRIASVRVIAGNQPNLPNLPSPLQIIGNRVVIEVDDSTDEANESGTGIENVTGTYTINDGTWVPLQLRPEERPGEGTHLSQSPSIERWVADIQASDPHFILYARDKAGNVAIFTGKGELGAPALPPPDSATITGPSSGLINTTYPFTATVEVPDTATTIPLTYTWTLTSDQYSDTPLTLEEGDLEGTVSSIQYSFSTTGTWTLGFEVGNEAGTVRDEQLITIKAPPEPEEDNRIYLPLILR